MDCNIYEDRSKENIKCDSCEKCFCKRCGNLTASEVKVLQLKERVMQFYCPSCQRSDRIVLMETIIENKNDLLKTKEDLIALLKEKVKNLENKMKDLEDNAVSYSAAFKTTPVTAARPASNMPDILIKPKNNETNINEMKRNIQSKLNPAELNIGINNIRTTKSGIIIKCPTANDLNNLKEKASEIFSDDYIVDITKLKKPKIKIAGYVGNQSIEEIESCIKNQNKWFTEEDEINITYLRKKKDNTCTIFAECSPKLFHKMTSFKKIYLEWQRLPVYEDLSIARCYRCQEFHHTSKKCNKDGDICEKCAGNHSSSTCTVSTYKCINCMQSNNRYKTKYKINHKASDLACPSHLYKIQSVRNKIQYN